MQYDDEKDPGTAALAAVAGLARSVETLTRDVAAMKTGLQQTASKTAVARLNDTVAALGNTVASFEDLLTRLAAKPGSSRGKASDSSDGEPVRSWLRLPEHDEAAVQAVLSELLPWMEATYLRYATARETLPPCWLWHPEIVEELLWLMDAWTAAYESPEASNKLVGDWHDRQRPGVTRRIGEYAPACDVLAHRDAAGAARRGRAAGGRCRPVRDLVGHRPRHQRPRRRHRSRSRPVAAAASPSYPTTTAGGQR